MSSSCIKYSDVDPGGGYLKCTNLKIWVYKNGIKTWYPNSPTTGIFIQTWDIYKLEHNQSDSRPRGPAVQHKPQGRIVAPNGLTGNQKIFPYAAVRSSWAADRISSTAPGCPPLSRWKCGVRTSVPLVFFPYSRLLNRSSGSLQETDDVQIFAVGEK